MTMHIYASGWRWRKPGRSPRAYSAIRRTNLEVPRITDAIAERTGATTAVLRTPEILKGIAHTIPTEGQHAIHRAAEHVFIGPTHSIPTETDGAIHGAGRRAFERSANTVTTEATAIRGA